MLETIKHILKRCMQLFAASFGKHRFAGDEPELLIVMYHRILPLDDERARYEEPGMIVTPETFRQHLQILKKHFDIMMLSEWINRKQRGGELPQRACAITFDDGWIDNYEFAYPILQQEQVPATIFLVTDMIGTTARFWPERLALALAAIARDHHARWQHPMLHWIRSMQTGYAFDDTVPTPEQLSEIIAGCKAMTDEEVHARLDTIAAEFGLDLDDGRASLLDWQQVNDMADSGLVEFGSHTCTHKRLNSSTDPVVMQRQVIDSKRRIKRHLDRDVRLFCYPNGDYSQRVLDLVVKHYYAAVTTESGWNGKSSDSFMLRRIGVHEDVAYDRTAFLARISGLM